MAVRNTFGTFYIAPENSAGKPPPVHPDISRTGGREITMNSTEFGAILKKGGGGAFLFYGDEDYLKRHYLLAARKALLSDPDTDTFNHIRIDEDTYSPDALSGAIQALPIMADKKLIEVSGIDYNSLPGQDREFLCDILSTVSSYEYNTLILYAMSGEFDGGTEKNPSPILKQFSDCIVPVRFNRETPARLARWIGQHFSSRGVFAEPALCSMLIDYSGSDMYTLAGEAEKLSALVLARGDDHLTEDDILRAAGKNESNDPFEFANAILRGDTDGALKQLAEKKKNREKPELLLAGISRVFSDLCLIRALSDAGLSQREIAAKAKMHEYKAGLYLNACRKKSPALLKRTLALCSEADLKIKSTALDSYVVLDRLVTEAATLRDAAPVR